MASCSQSLPFKPLRSRSKSRARPLTKLAASLWVLSVVAFVGCSNGAAVSGTVSFDGQPIAEGTITFSSVENASLDSRTQAKIVEGLFAIEKHQLLMPGSYQVAVRASRQAGKVQADEGSPELVDRYEQYIPVIYNSRSQLTAEITGDVEGLQFELETPKNHSRRRR